MKIKEAIPHWAKKLKDNLIVLHLAIKDKRTPWYAKALILFTIAYALSPIDLIPDFIPVLGYLDDLIILPALIFLSLKLIPTEIITECRLKSEDYEWKKKKSMVGLMMVVFVWLIIISIVLLSVLEHHKK